MIVNPGKFHADILGKINNHKNIKIKKKIKNDNKAVGVKSSVKLRRGFTEVIGFT